MKQLIIFLVLVVGSLVFISTAKGVGNTTVWMTHCPSSASPFPPPEAQYGFKGDKIDQQRNQPINNVTILVPTDALNGKVDKREQRIVDEVQNFYERKARGEPVTYAELQAITGLPATVSNIPGEQPNKPNPDKPIEDSPKKDTSEADEVKRVLEMLRHQ